VGAFRASVKRLIGGVEVQVGQVVLSMYTAH